MVHLSLNYSLDSCFRTLPSLFFRCSPSTILLLRFQIFSPSSFYLLIRAVAGLTMAQNYTFRFFPFISCFRVTSYIFLLSFFLTCYFCFSFYMKMLQLVLQDRKQHDDFSFIPLYTYFLSLLPLPCHPILTLIVCFHWQACARHLLP